jgi:hypothetical protein
VPLAVKVAVHVFATSKFNNDSGLVVPVQSPPQLVKVKLVAGTAIRFTESPLLIISSQVVPQLMVLPAMIVPLVGGVMVNLTCSPVGFQK